MQSGSHEEVLLFYHELLNPKRLLRIPRERDTSDFLAFLSHLDDVLVLVVRLNQLRRAINVFVRFLSGHFEL